MSDNSYDIIGDVHGCGDSLEKLLGKLGYLEQDGVYRHPQRQAIFIGDLIDRGPRQRDVVDLARTMVEAGTARVVMGNHEFNALAFAARDPLTGDFLRPHSPKNIGQHRAFIDAYSDDREGYESALQWFMGLPLWLDLGGLKVVHACWHKHFKERIEIALNGGPHLSDQFLVEASRKGTWQFEVVETLLKGQELRLPPGFRFFDKDGNERHHIRVRWWDQGARTYREAYIGPESARTHIPADELHGDHLVEYAHDAPPVFIGHYWLDGTPEPLAANIGCVDYSVAKPCGKLVAYRWDGEKILDRANYVWVSRAET